MRMFINRLERKIEFLIIGEKLIQMMIMMQLIIIINCHSLDKIAAIESKNDWLSRVTEFDTKGWFWLEELDVS